MSAEQLRPARTKAPLDVLRQNLESHGASPGSGGSDFGDVSPANGGSALPQGGCSPSARLRDPAELQQDLDETSAQRRDAEIQLQDLNAQLKSLQAKVRECEQTWQQLAKKEARLQNDLAAQQDGLEAEDSDGADGRLRSPRKSEPVVFNLQELQDSSGHQIQTFFDLECGPVSMSDGEDDDDLDDWEDGLDALGIAKCRLCGLKLPLDIDTIDKHSKECEQARARGSECRPCDSSELLSGAGRCKRCGELIPLDVDAIEHHSKVCRASSGSADVSPTGSNAGEDTAKTASKKGKPRRASGLWRWGTAKK